jgi:hypothetical protein
VESAYAGGQSCRRLRIRARRGSRAKAIIEEQAAKIWAEALDPFAGYLFGNNNIINNSQYVSE